MHANPLALIMCFISYKKWVPRGKCPSTTCLPQRVLWHRSHWTTSRYIGSTPSTWKLCSLQCRRNEHKVVEKLWSFGIKINNSRQMVSVDLKTGHIIRSKKRKKAPLTLSSSRKHSFAHNTFLHCMTNKFIPLKSTPKDGKSPHVKRLSIYAHTCVYFFY